MSHLLCHTPCNYCSLILLSVYFTVNSLSFTDIECLSVIHTCEHVVDFSRATVIIDVMFNVLAA